MASNLYFSRDTKLFAVIRNVSAGVTSTTPSAAFELPILDGFSFSQANNTSEITLAEMEDATTFKSRRGRRLFNDSLAPAEWSFSTYVRPFAADASGDYTSGNIHAVEEILWAQMAGADQFTGDAFLSDKFSDNPVTVTDATDLDITFAESNRSVLHGIELYFVMETNSVKPVVYKLDAACVNEANITFDVDGIATIEWSGFAKNIVDETANAVVYGAGLAVTALPGTPLLNTIYLDNDADNAFTIGDGQVGSGIAAKDDGVASTSNFIRNRLTTLAVTADNETAFPGAAADGVYNMTLTGGSITISNNVEYLTPEEIGKVNIPLENVTGARSVTGSFTCYLNFDDASNLGTSTDFFNDFKSDDALDIVTNKFNVVFKIGGATGQRLEATMANTHIEIPVTNIEDVISYEVNFHGLGTTIDSTDEVTLKYDI